MRELLLKPAVYTFDTCAAFAAEFELGPGDLMITNEFIYEPNFAPLQLGCDTLFQEKYGSGEPSDDMVEAMARDVKKPYRRIVAVGGGTVLDIAKLFALETMSPVLDLYDGKIPPVKARPLVLVPTTCGTGSEVTNIAILALNSRGTKKGLAVDAMYADAAVLVPELLQSLPFRFFSTSSIDALIHAVESTLSPKGNTTTRLFGYRAMEMILRGYQAIAENGEEARLPLMADFLLAANYAGIAFSNAGCAAVHAMSYPLGAAYHVAHGESNYAIFTGVLRNYMEMDPSGELLKLNAFLAEILSCDEADVYTELENLLNRMIPKKALHEYGVTPAQLEEFADSVVENQQRLLQNNFVPFDRERILKIYKELY